MFLFNTIFLYKFNLIFFLFLQCNNLSILQMFFCGSLGLLLSLNRKMQAKYLPNQFDRHLTGVFLIDFILIFHERLCGQTERFIGNGVVHRKQNETCFGFKNYHVLMLQRPIAQFQGRGPDSSPRERRRESEYIFHKVFFPSTYKRKFGHCVCGTVYFGGVWSSW